MKIKSLFALVNGRRVAFLLVDAMVLALSLYLAFLLRFDGHIPHSYIPMFLWMLLLALGVKIPVLTLFRIYRFSWAHVGMEELYNTIVACGLGSAALAAVIFALRDWSALATVPRSILAVDFAFTLIGIAGARLSKRLVRHALTRTNLRAQGRRTLIVGAGDAGEQLLKGILQEKRAGYWPVGFVDDDRGKQGMVIHGVRVLGPREKLADFVRAKQAEVVIIAMPSVPSPVIRETVELTRESGVQDIKIIPFFSQLYTGEVRVSEVREVQPEDLLGRAPVSVDVATIRHFLQGKTVLVTGAAGSIGSEICRQALRFGVKQLVAIDIDETGLFNLEKDLARRFPNGTAGIVIGDVRDQKRVAGIFGEYHPQVVFHAAAYKHVPLMEAFPAEAVKTNVFGTRIVVEEACQAGAEAFVMISTDKAVNPTSIMGATKRVAEMVVLDEGQKAETRCMAVRFGNVLGSRGSVIPTFTEQIKRGGPVTVTDPGMERYFMITAEAVLLVLQAGAMGKGGEVFVLDMGQPVKILDLARELIRFHGLEPDKEIPIVFTGIRPGEKLCEELLTAEEGTDATTHDKIFKARLSACVSGDQIDSALICLYEAAEQSKPDEIIATLKELVPVYAPRGRSGEEVE